MYIHQTAYRKELRWLTALLATAVLAVLLPQASARAATTITVSPGTGIQALVDANPEGTSFLLKAGTHRNQQVVPKNGDIFIGENGAIMSGAKILTTFTVSGTRWVATGQTAQGDKTGTCVAGYTACVYPEQLFRDGVQMWQVATLAEVSAGEWFFDYAADKVYVGDNPTGHTVELSVTPYAFTGSADNVTIQNLIVERYANTSTTGAIHPRDGANGTFGTGWVLTDVEARYNTGEGVSIGPTMVVSSGYMHHNGRIGIGGGGEDLAGAIVTGNEVSYNCIGGFLCFGWGGGGIKIGQGYDIVISGNNVHDNYGKGIHADVSIENPVIEGNTVTNNQGAGIQVEVTYGAIVRNNVITGNGNTQPTGRGAGIMVNTASDVEVYGNTVSGNGNGIVGQMTTRDPGPLGPHELTNLYVHDNTVTMNAGWTGIKLTVSDTSFYTSKNNRFVANTYDLGTGTKYYLWQGSLRTTAEWKGYGQDLTGIWLP